MSIWDFIAVVSFGLTCFCADTHSAEIITRYKNNRPVW